MSRKVLIVEDEPPIRSAIRYVLEKNGHQVTEASNVREALSLASDCDIILLDLKLGSESGDQFLKELRNRGLYTPVIAISGVYSRAEVEARLAKFKIIDFIEKPFKQKELIEKVESAARVAGTMESTCEAADRVVAATQSLRLLAGKSITELGGRPAAAGL